MEGRNNFSVEEGEFFPRYSKGEPVSVIFLTWTALMSVVGCVGNSMVIGAVLTHKRLRTLGNVFIVNLAITDTLITLFVATFGMVGILSDGYFYHDKPVLCNVIGAICMIACSCSLWSIASISLNRYISICHRLVYPRVYNKRNMPFIIALLWFICFMIDFPNLVDWGSHAYDPRLMMCTYDFTYRYTYTLFFIGFGFGVPLSVSIYCYIRIVRLAHQSKLNIMEFAGASSNYNKNVAKKQLLDSDRKLLKSVFVILSTFVLMWLPHAVMVVGDYYARWPRLLHVIGAALAHGNSSVNSVIYAATNKTFREGYVLVIRCVSNCIWPPFAIGKSRRKESFGDLRSRGKAVSRISLKVISKSEIHGGNKLQHNLKVVGCTTTMELPNATISLHGMTDV